MRNRDSAPVWFITGCSTGLGRALAQRVLLQGWRAAVTARHTTNMEDLVTMHSGTALALALDVTDRDRMADAVAQAEKKFGRIDVLVNNAGYGYLAAVEEGEEDEVRAMFETNFFALVALTKMVLPGMRARGSGHIINMSSVGGLVANSSSGYYSATKFAVEGLSEALANEVEPLGIRVTVIEPGPFRTDFTGRSLRHGRHPIPPYAATAGARRAEIAQNYGKQPGDPVRAADAIIRVALSTNPPRNLVLGKIGLDRVRSKLKKLMSTIDEWESVAVGADFPQP